MRRRDFLLSSCTAAALASTRRAEAARKVEARDVESGRKHAAAAAGPRFAHRQASMTKEPGPAVFDFARRIDGLSGVELQVHFKGTTLWDDETSLAYLRAARAAGLAIPSLAGVWPSGASIRQPEAEEHLRKAVRAAERLGSATVLVACFDANCPRMDDESSYGPVVTLLQRASTVAREGGVVLAMETSLSPADDRRLVDLVDRREVGVYYDLDNVERYGHTGEAVPGIAVLGPRIRQVHLKNGERLLSEAGRVDWTAAVEQLARAGYAGWLAFESSHPDPEQCVAATRENIAFVRRHFVA